MRYEVNSEDNSFIELSSNKSYKHYRSKVDQLTKYVLEQNKVSIENGYHIDHIFPVSYGFKLKIPVEVMADINNLQILEASENIKKSNKCETIPQFIQNYLLGVINVKLTYDKKNKQREGIEKAKQKGVYKGRVNGSVETIENFISKPKNKEAIRLLKEGNYKKVQISKIVGIHVNTITKLSKIIKEYNL